MKVLPFSFGIGFLFGGMVLLGLNVAREGDALFIPACILLGVGFIFVYLSTKGT